MNSSLLGRVLLACSLLSGSLFAQGPSGLGLRFVGELDEDLEQRIREAIAVETGRSPDPNAPDEQAAVTITASGDGELLVRYRPAEGELTRALAISDDPDNTAQNVALIVQHLILREAGPVAPDAAPPPPGPARPTSERAPSPVPGANPPPTIEAPVEPPTCPAPVTCSSENRGAEAAPVRLHLGARAGAFGVTTHGGGQGSSDASWGLRLGVQAPVFERLSLGTDMGLTWHSAAFTGEEGRSTELEQTSWDFSANVGLWLVAPGGPLEAELVASFGALIPLETSGRNIGLEPDSDGSYHGQAGYRAAGMLRGTHWFGQNLGLTAGVGVEFQFSVSNSALGLGPDSVRDHVHVWHTQPVLALGGVYRF